MTHRWLLFPFCCLTLHYTVLTPLLPWWRWLQPNKQTGDQLDQKADENRFHQAWPESRTLLMKPHGARWSCMSGAGLSELFPASHPERSGSGPGRGGLSCYAQMCASQVVPGPRGLTPNCWLHRQTFGKWGEIGWNFAVRSVTLYGGDYAWNPQ